MKKITRILPAFVDKQKFLPNSTVVALKNHFSFQNLLTIGVVSLFIPTPHALSKEYRNELNNILSDNVVEVQKINKHSGKVANISQKGDLYYYYDDVLKKLIVAGPGKAVYDLMTNKISLKSKLLKSLDVQINEKDVLSGTSFDLVEHLSNKETLSNSEKELLAMLLNEGHSVRECKANGCHEQFSSVSNRTYLLKEGKAKSNVLEITKNSLVGNTKGSLLEYIDEAHLFTKVPFSVQKDSQMTSRNTKLYPAVQELRRVLDLDLEYDIFKLDTLVDDVTIIAESMYSKSKYEREHSLHSIQEIDSIFDRVGEILLETDNSDEYIQGLKKRYAYAAMKWYYSSLNDHMNVMNKLVAKSWGNLNKISSVRARYLKKVDDLKREFPLVTETQEMYAEFQECLKWYDARHRGFLNIYAKEKDPNDPHKKYDQAYEKGDLVAMGKEQMRIYDEMEEKGESVEWQKLKHAKDLAKKFVSSTRPMTSIEVKDYVLKDKFVVADVVEGDKVVGKMWKNKIVSVENGYLYGYVKVKDLPKDKDGNPIQGASLQVKVMVSEYSGKQNHVLYDDASPEKIPRKILQLTKVGEGFVWRIPVSMEDAKSGGDNLRVSVYAFIHNPGHIAGRPAGEQFAKGDY